MEGRANLLYLEWLYSPERKIKNCKQKRQYRLHWGLTLGNHLCNSHCRLLLPWLRMPCWLFCYPGLKDCWHGQLGIEPTTFGTLLSVRCLWPLSLGNPFGDLKIFIQNFQFGGNTWSLNPDSFANSSEYFAQFASSSPPLQSKTPSQTNFENTHSPGNMKKNQNYCCSIYTIFLYVYQVGTQTAPWSN